MAAKISLNLFLEVIYINSTAIDNMEPVLTLIGS